MTLMSTETKGLPIAQGQRRSSSNVLGALRDRALVGWIVPILLLIGWEVLSRMGVLRAHVLPAPTVVLATFWKLLQDGSLLKHIGVSALRAGAGFIIGASIGFAFGLANGLSRLSRDLTDTSLQMIRNIPHLALIPLVILWFGIGEQAKVFLVALGVFFPIYVNTLLGVQGVDPQLIEMGKIYRLGSWDLFRRVILPGALPAIFTGLRYALGIMWLTLIVAETISASAGLGYMAMQAREFLQIDVVVLSILIYALLGKLADSLARALEWRCLNWHPAFEKKAAKS